MSIFLIGKYFTYRKSNLNEINFFLLILQPNYEALKEHCNLWRNWGDIDDSYQSLNSITDYFAANAGRIVPHSGPGHWNDPDMVDKILQNISILNEIH